MTGEILQIFIRTLESFKIGTLMGFFYRKHKMYKLDTFRGVMCHENKE